MPAYDRTSTVPPQSKIQALKFGLKEKVRSSPRAVPPPASASPVSSGRFACGGCKRTVFQMEKGVVPGPQGSKWHLGCLVCGGKNWRALRESQRRSGESQFGCGKKLDSQAKCDGDGQVWCNECLVSSKPHCDDRDLRLSFTVNTSPRAEGSSVAKQGDPSNK